RAKSREVMASGKDSDRTLGYMTRKDTEVKLPRPTRVKNKTPAPVQITAEQILREARERQEAEIRPPKQKITDSTELSDYRLRRRKEFEDKIRRARWNIQVWMKYAQNVWDRAVTLLPRVDQLWYKYIHMEEILGNIAGARQIFERWMQWSPDQQGWLSFIKFELRYNEIERARSIYERFVLCHPKVSAYIRFAKFEMKGGEVARARHVYERATEKLADDEEAETLFVAFAEFEERCKEPERARFIYKFALDHIPKGRAEDLYKKFVAFEKQYGDREGIEDAIVGKRRFQYEDEVRKNPLNYDSWFDYVRLEETVGNKDRIREIYERAIANIPPAEEKRYWQRYIYLWINYALYEEIETEDVERTRDVYRECLKLIPHSKFSFAKIWLLAAQFEIRQLNLAGARQILGNAIGKAPKDKIFKKYIEIELQLGNIDRCRKLYERYLEWSPENCYAWSKYAELERSLAETERARAIFELAISQPALDMPELLWKIFERANSYYKDSAPELKEERATLLEDWLNMETNFGNLGDVSVVQSKLPKKLKKRKPITREDGSTEYEEYIDYLYPEESQTTNLKILEAAYKINYALYEKIETEDVERTRDILGNAIGKAPKDKIFKKYIEIELQMGNIDRCRKLYERYLEWSPENCYAWSKYAELERSLAETERARAIFELAISQPALDMPELLWKCIRRTRGNFELHVVT
ncbi:hypothetical protein HID58_015202, partial [Brassica napus]